MALVVVAPLEAQAHDLRRIETLRRRHDPYAGTIGAHVTLVFPFDAPGREAAAAHVAAVAAQSGAVALRLATAIAVPDALAACSRLFLVPDQGRAEIEALHDALHSGPLASALRPEMPYIPHVTVGAFAHHDEAEEAARAAGRIAMPARLTRLELVDWDGAAARVLERFELFG